MIGLHSDSLLSLSYYESCSLCFLFDQYRHSSFYSPLKSTAECSWCDFCAQPEAICQDLWIKAFASWRSERFIGLFTTVAA